jgi:hypothetical protein
LFNILTNNKMASLEDSFHNGGYVTTKGGNENVVTGTLSQVPGAAYMGQQWVGGLMIVMVFMLLVAMQMGYVQCMMEQDEGFGNVEFIGAERTDGFSNVLARQLADRRNESIYNKSAFMNSRETPYYDSYPNRTMQMEDRERAAVLALAKINQERLRKAEAAAAAEAAETGVSAPLAWDAFWKEWKVNHPLDGEDVVDGYRNDPHERNELSPY